jgi:hypothetical protein
VGKNTGEGVKQEGYFVDGEVNRGVMEEYRRQKKRKSPKGQKNLVHCD